MEESLEWFEKGVTLYEKGEYGRAISSFDKAITINPSMVEAHNNRGLSLIQMGKYQEALASFNDALSLDPKHENAKKAKKIVLELLGNKKESITSEEKKNYHKHGEYLALIGLILIALSMFVIRSSLLSGVGFILAVAGAIVVYTNQ